MLAVLLFLVPVINSSVSSFSSLVARISLSAPKSCFSLEEIIKQGDALRAATLGDETRIIVEKMDSKLSEFLELGVAPHDAVSIINSFFIDVQELVLAAIDIRAYTLLKLLQVIYIWRDEAQFHWFQALSYKSPWYDESMWNTYPMNWGENLRAICKIDNDALAMIVRKDVSSFDEKLLLLCIKYDAIKIFEFAKFTLIQLEEHLELLSTNSSAKLLKLYKIHTKMDHLHLERFSFPEKLPIDVDGFEFLMDNGHNCFPIKQFTEIFCTKGRLDLLQYLHKLNPSLIPTLQDLYFAAERGWIDILRWALQLERDNVWCPKEFADMLAINQHFRALDTWLNENNLNPIETIECVIEAGVLKALVWIDTRQPIDQNQQEWTNLAAENGHFSILKWLYDKFGLFPSVESLEKANNVLIERMNDSNDLAYFEEENLEFLQWIFENAPSTILDANKQFLLLNVLSKRAMKWLYGKLEICSFNMDWAYLAGDLEAIQWAIENCQLFPVEKNALHAIEKGHFHIIKWIYETYPEKLHVAALLKVAIECGNLAIADFLISNFTLNEAMEVHIHGNIGADQHLSSLKWAHKHGFCIFPPREMDSATRKGDFQTVRWIIETFQINQSNLDPRYYLVLFGHHEIYQWLFERYPEWYLGIKLWWDIGLAYDNGHLEFVKMILNKDSTLVQRISTSETHKSNYHIRQWLITNGFVEK